jgi:hypothetical protein
MRATFVVQVRRIAVVLALVICFTSETRAQGPAAEFAAPAATKVEKARPSSAVRAKAKPESGQQEGIKVHGNWTIVIRNPDGSVSSRHQFKNALVPSLGGQMLLRVLRHDSGIGEWSIAIQGTPAPCDSTTLGRPANCIFTQTPGTDTNVFPTLTLTIPQTGPDAFKLVLTASAKAAHASQLTAVSTFIQECPANVAPANFCSGNPFGVQTFTFQAIGTQNITVLANQTIDVTVVISFS